MADSNANANGRRIPQVSWSPGLLLTPGGLTKGDLTTIFIGVVTPEYTENNWVEDRTAMLKLLEVPTAESCVEIPLQKDVKGGERVSQLIATALLKISSSTQVRFVHLGKLATAELFEVLKSLIRQWCQDATGKNVKFITTGCAHEMLGFWKWSILRNCVNSVEIYDTRDYDEQGSIDQEMSMINEFVDVHLK